MTNNRIELLCEQCGYYPAVGEADLGCGSGVKFYCRKCMLEAEEEDYEVDDSLIFCSAEWDRQA